MNVHRPPTLLIFVVDCRRPFPRQRDVAVHLAARLLMVSRGPTGKSARAFRSTAESRGLRARAAPMARRVVRAGASMRSAGVAVTRVAKRRCVGIALRLDLVEVVPGSLRRSMWRARRSGLPIA